MAQIIETPDKVVVVTGTPFSSGVRLILFGAAIGAGGMYYLLTKKQPEKKFKPGRALLVNPVKRKGQAALDAGQAKLEDVGDTVSGVASDVQDRVGDAGEAIEERAKRLFERVKNLAGHAKDLAQTTGETLKPRIHDAIEEGKKTAAEVQSRLKDDMKKAGDRPALAEEDGELPSQQPDKHVE
ncbi:hypothetical protein IAD21_03497 [Abditibacteriota bacterium]|nr:hypothetical protein IAD21_03497 [Abditibacteriota bacterium]